MLDLTGQVAVITGSGGGIGAVIARRLACQGAQIVINDVNADGAERVAADLRELGVQTLVSVGSVTRADDVDAMVKSTMDTFGRLDILVNNAGITRDGPMIRMTEEQWDLVLDINLKGAFLCTRAAVRPMMKAEYGRIVNISSVVGVGGNKFQANYSASKGGLIALTKSTAQEFASRNITCNAVAPGFIETAMTHVLSEEVRAGWLSRIPLARPGTAEDVANVVAFLASPEAGYVTGQCLNIDGGLIM
ncbi:MAG: 3-oxoacyl-[acyl-carrier-protein] reductase [Armatimonadetes bacterium]|nr:3-oxoacyl-[acyl-carrier-protein] reductase [Armatimonadota bacterium]